MQKLPLAEVEKRLGSSPNGLSEIEAKSAEPVRPKRDRGEEDKRAPKISQLLLGADSLDDRNGGCALGGRSSWPDFFIILVLLVANASIGFWEEREAGNAIDV